MSESVARTPTELLDRVIDELTGLRNAGNRSPLFKLWRQNALTAIQRIWPGDVQHSERFRRIPFSAPNTRADGREVRECYERGCGEALSLLKMLRDEAVDRTFAHADASARRHSFEPGAVEDDFPTLELSADSVSTPEPEARKRRASNSDLPLDDEPYGLDNRVDPSISSVRDLAPRPARSTHDAPRAAEPKLKTPTDAAAAPPARPAAKAAGSANAKPKPKHAKKPAPKGRLKDMLGFGDMTNEETPAAGSALPMEPHVEEAPAPPPPVVSEERRRPEASSMREAMSELASTIKEARAQAAKPASKRWTPGATRAERAQTPAPEPVEPAASAAPEPPPLREVPPAREAPVARPAAEPPARPVRRQALPPAEFLMPPDLDAAEVEPIHEEAPAPRPVVQPKRALPAAMEPDAPQEPIVEPLPSDGLHAAERDDSASVMAEFLRNSPVLSSMPKAVAKKVPVVLETFESPTASALQALSAMVAEIGVPEGHRARARAALLDMARQIDGHQMSWDNMREAVQFLMEFPPLARRALPLLLPHLDQAA